MLSYLLRRLLSMVVVMAMVGVSVFVITRLVPGEPAAILAGDDATVEDIARIRRQYGLDRPIAVQFVIWSGEIIKGNLGQSIFFGQPVTRLLLDRAQPTILLSLMALVIAMLIGIPAGVVSAIARGSVIDQTILGVAMVNAAVPSFLLGLLLMQYLAVSLGWFPVAGFGPPDASTMTRITYLVLPALSLALPNAALIARMTRGSMLDVLGEDYVRTARAKGVAAVGVFLKHALRNASVNILTVVGIIAGALLSGVVVVETVFGLPGVGQLVMSAVLRRDYPTIQGALVVIAGVYVLVNLAVDLLYAVIDPRIVY
jgi:peptide/nickel transport system permease protein